MLPDHEPLTPGELARLGLSGFTAIDLETTGTDPGEDRALELGAVRYEGGREVERFSELIAIEGRIPPVITRLTGITDSDLDSALPIEEALPRYLEFIDDGPVVGHNVEFDLGFIRAEQKRLTGNATRWTPGPVHDTLPAARGFFPLLSSYSLSALAHRCDVTLADAHRAVNDAKATAEILLHLLAAARRIPFGELKEMLRLLGGPVTPFGQLLDGLIAIKPGPPGPITTVNLPDNRVGSWNGDSDETADQAIDPADIEAFFAEDGPLARELKGFRRREGQVKMARDVFRVMNDGGVLLAEAGTGTGKSFAYLLPSVLHARSGGGKVVVSTQTRHLQDQLFFKDIPTINHALGGGVRAMLLKGRGNYICRRRYEMLTSDPQGLSLEERYALLPLVRWLNMTCTGDISEVNAFRAHQVRGLWSKISAESGFCTSRVCRDSKNCFLHRIRTSVPWAHLVLVNHSLLFSDLAAGGAILGKYDRLVFDEAHHIEKIAAAHLGMEYSISIIRAVLNRLYEDKSEQGLLIRLHNIAGGMLTPLERGVADVHPLEKAIDATREAVSDAEDFNREMDELLRPEMISSEQEYSRKVRFRKGKELFSPIAETLAKHEESLKKLLEVLNDICDELEETELKLDKGDDLVGELGRLTAEVQGIVETVKVLTGEENRDIVCWYDLPVNPKHPVRLHAAPLNISEILESSLFSRLKSLVLTSATMAVDESFDYLAGRLGLKNYSGGIYDSPFDLHGQLFIASATFLGNPKDDPQRFAKMVARLSYRLSTELDAGTLALFTSGRMLREAYDYARPNFDRDGWMLLGQGLDGGQAILLEQFKLERRSVLFGLDSFWEGIDVPGEALELLVVARLPFDVPTDPLVQARSEKIEREGGNPFIEYTVPECALKLRQGIGRLIRTNDDVGAAVICDPRIVRSRWGKIILNSLPVRAVEFEDYDQLFDALLAFLGEPEE